MYTLLSEDLRDVGGPMYMARSYKNYTKHFKSIKAAKEFAEKEYGKPIEWSKRNEYITSGDLHYVMYTIRKVKVES